MRAVVFIADETRKGTARSPQEYENPLLVLTGEEYARVTFDELHRRLCDALRGERPRLTMQVLRPDGWSQLIFEDGSTRWMEK